MTGEERLAFCPLTVERWADFERLFGERGACGGCWCMWWKLKRSDFEKQKGLANKNAMKALVDSGEVPGILAYANGDPIGWCAVAPRESYPVLERSRVLKRVDNVSVWSVTCFFVAKSHRRQGLTTRLLRSAIEFVRQRGGEVLEGYPVEPKTDSLPAAFAWTGLVSAFRQAGFVEVARHSPTRPIMRYTIGKRAKRK